MELTRAAHRVLCSAPIARTALITLSNKSWERGRRGGDLIVKTSVLPNNCYVCWSPAFWDMTEHRLLIRNREYLFCLSLCFHTAFVCFLSVLSLKKNYLYLSPWAFLFPIILSSPLLLWGEGVREQLWWGSPSHQCEATTVLFGAYCGAWRVEITTYLTRAL